MTSTSYFLHRGAPIARTLVLLVIFDWGCQRSNQSKQPEQSIPDRAALESERLFQKRLECGRLLAQIRGSVLHPDSLTSVETRFKAEHGALVNAPIVFYSPTLNTCAYINGVEQSPKLAGRNVENISVDGLLSGQSIELRSFNLDNAAEASAARKYEDEIIPRYGGLIPPSEHR